MVAAQISIGQIDLKWRPDVVHNHDWQTGLVAAFLHDEPHAPRSIFTIHNLSYLGLFPSEEYVRLQLPMSWWNPEGLEFYGGFSMLKAGLVYSDAINTVSPTYAKEILTPEFGYGMEGVLNHYHYKLSGILNGLDSRTWDPASDPLLEKNYSIKNRKSGKRANKKALLQSLDIYDIDQWMNRPIFGSVGRLVEQKGIDILASVIPQLLAQHDAGFIIIGDGQPQFTAQLTALQYHYPNQVRLFIGYSEKEAHLVEAGADFFIMPSRFEPCGLNQLYSLKYGTLPIVHSVGGLADTVVHADKENIKNKKATGIVFKQASSKDLLGALVKAIKLYQNKDQLQQVQKTAMQQDFGWHQSAKQYLALYRQ
jgi:starch synthase